jgi:hypothetical protein
VPSRADKNSYRREDYAAWLEAAGFGAIEFKALPGPTGLVIGKKQ